jgi:hypothetical protein
MPVEKFRRLFFLFQTVLKAFPLSSLPQEISQRINDEAFSSVPLEVLNHMSSFP